MLNGLREDDIFTRNCRCWRSISWRSILFQKRAGAEESTIVVVDDDKDFRDSLGDLFNSVGFKVKLFGSAAELLEGDFCPTW